MPIQVISLLIFTLGVIFGGPSGHADEPREVAGRRVCFDFTKKLPELLKKPQSIPDSEIPRISSKSGVIRNDMYWAMARGQVGRPIQELIQEISQHETLKSHRVSKMEIALQDSPDYLIRQKVEYTVTPFIFVKVKWTEDWGFSLTQGTKEAPKEVEIFYEKTEGTSHIKHLCGNMVLTEINPKVTDVFIYEEAQATSRTEEDEAKGLVSTIRTFRYGRND